MRLGASYNFFNGEEHLAASVESVRSSCDVINVVFQNVSNAGEPASAEAISVLQGLATSGLVDQVLDYVPDLNLARQENELSKRKLGLKNLKRRRCSHFLGMDADEFYRAPEIATAKQLIAKNGYGRTSVSSFFHIQRPVFRAKDTTNVAFICRLNLFTKLGGAFPKDMIDPTRTVQTVPKNHHHFDREIVAMYHMNFVRRDIAAKLRNSSTVDGEFLDAVGKALINWKFGEPFRFPRKGSVDVMKVTNEFETFDPIKSGRNVP